MLYYRFNLKLPNLTWTGTRGCKKKYLKSPQWIRNIKDRKYPFYRLDALFSEKKFISCEIIKNGGWHFTNIKTAIEIQHKLRSYLHHIEFDLEPLSVEQIRIIMNEKCAIYNLNVDQRTKKFGKGEKLLKYDFQKLPDYIKNNKSKFERWLD